MTTVTFDTLKFTQRLEQAGISRDQAVAMAEAQKESLPEIMEAHLATKNDVQDVKIKQVEHDGQFTLIKWMLGILITGVLSIMIKMFF
ncbi:MAG: DUF1640 domain-containing protein [Methylobacter sp.]|nr:DUF1640 domain-containing protein [Methylobacter sp.]